MRARLLPALALLAALPACGDPEPGTLVGDVFLAEHMGQEVNLTGAPVHLIPEAEEIDTTLARLCPPREGGAAPRSGEAVERAWGERARLLQARAQRTVRTNEQAQFVMDSVAPGRYRLWADTTVDGTRWTWLHSVRVTPGDTVRANLTNANPDENPFRCP